MNIVFVHKEYPGQYGHLAHILAERHGDQCTFIYSRLPARVQEAIAAGRPAPGGPGLGGPVPVASHGDPIERGVRLVNYRVRGASPQTHPCGVHFEISMWNNQAVLEAMMARPAGRRLDRPARGDGLLDPRGQPAIDEGALIAVALRQDGRQVAVLARVFLVHEEDVHRRPTGDAARSSWRAVRAGSTASSRAHTCSIVDLTVSVKPRGGPGSPGGGGARPRPAWLRTGVLQSQFNPN